MNKTAEAVFLAIMLPLTAVVFVAMAVAAAIWPGQSITVLDRVVIKVSAAILIPPALVMLMVAGELQTFAGRMLPFARHK